MLASIASTLECAPADLAGGEVPAPDRATASARAGVLGLRRALIDIRDSIVRQQGFPVTASTRSGHSRRPVIWGNIFGA